MILHKQVIAALLPILLFFTFTAASLAQTPNIGGALEQSAPPTPRETPAKPPETLIPIEEAPETLEIPEGETLLIKVFRIENSEEEDWRSLQEMLAPLQFKEMTMSDITDAANQVTLYYRERGYITAKAYVPPQDATNGVLVIRIVLGEYGELYVRNASAIRTSFLRGVFGKAKNDSPIVQREKLERAMLIARDMPGGGIPQVSIMSGEEPDTSDFIFEMGGSSRLGGYAMANNQGSKYTGEYRVYGGVDVNSLLGFSDKFSASYMTTDETDLKSYRFSYDFPLAYNGLRAEASVARTDYELGGEYSALGATGSADIVEVGIKYPIIKRPAESMNFIARGTFKRMSDDLDLGGVELIRPRNSTALTFALNREAYNGIGRRGLFTKISGGFDIGNLNITDIIQEVVDAAGAFMKLNLDAAAEFSLVGNLSLGGSAKFQKILTGKNVDSTEQFFISGAGGVRAWTESIGFDNGYTVGAELKYALPGSGGLRHSVNLFMDKGSAWAVNGEYTTIEEFSMSDAGPGYSASYRRLFGAVNVAIPVDRSMGIGNPGTRVLWQAGISW